MSDSKLTRAQGVVLLVVVPVGLFMFGAVTSALWGWFVVPTFGAPPCRSPRLSDSAYSRASSGRRLNGSTSTHS